MVGKYGIGEELGRNKKEYIGLKVNGEQLI